MCNMEVKKPFSILILHQQASVKLTTITAALLCMTAEEDHSLNR